MRLDAVSGADLEAIVLDAYHLAVDTARRHGGLGRRMMAEAERWLRERGAVKVNLMVRNDNAAALGFYERLGYRDAQTTVLARWLDDPAPSDLPAGS